jgi:hypothetical protein
LRPRKPAPPVMTIRMGEGLEKRDWGMGVGD